MYVVFRPSPSVAHKYRVILPDKRAIDFGQVNVEDYTDHQDPRRMRAQLIRKGGNVPKRLKIERDPYEIHRGMLMVDESTTEHWDDQFHRDFWERWMLWSYPNIEHAKLWVTMRKGILFMPTPEDMWYNPIESL
jgi:hypothetical protein